MSTKVTFDCELFNVTLRTDDPYTLETIIGEFGRMVADAAKVASSTPIGVEAEDD